MDEYLSKLDQARDDMERLREEKDQEIEILNASMDNTLKELDEAQQVCQVFIVENQLSILVESRPGR